MPTTVSHSGSSILYDKQDQIVVVTLNRPERLNAWTRDMEVRYFDALDRADADPEVRVIVVTGAGRGFCAGADIDDLQARGGGKRLDSDLVPERPQTFPLSIRKPVLAAINGACAGIGLVQALMCDIRFSAAGAKFTTSFSRRGLIAEHGSSWILPRLTGHARALDLLLSGRVFLAEEALQLGVVNRISESANLLDEVLSYAQDLAQNCSPMSMAVIKSQIYRHLQMDLENSLADSNVAMRESLERSDFREGVASSIERRPPNFHRI